LDKSFTTLAEVLQKNGYSTGAVVGSFVLDRRFGLDQGFDFYHDTFKKPGSPRFYHGQWQGHDIDIFESTADEVTLEALRWIHEQWQNKFFLFLHYMDPHAPYTPPDRFLKAFPENPYYGEVAFVDECVSYIIRYLKKSGLSDNTLIIITADHGESLGEHDYMGHAYVLYDQVLRIPLVVKDPSGNLSPGYHSFQINSIDIMPSLLDLLSIPIPPDVQGKSFLPLLSTEKKRSDKFSYSETLMPSLRQGKAEMYSLRDRTWKLINYVFPKGGEKSFLYDLSTDRKELVDMANRRPDVVKDMSEKLLNFRKLESYHRFRHMIPADRETVEKLKALGYIGN
jgi:arylsulfatase A-like enzyme